MKKTVLLTIQYDGSKFHGWQRQPGECTAQGKLEEVLSEICCQDIKVDGTSRTDAGVHALGQRATFAGDFSIPVENIKKAVNDMLSKGATYKGKSGAMRIIKAEEVPEGFHARFNSVGKRYRYLIDCAKEIDLFNRNYVYALPEDLDAEAMKEAAKNIIGTHDFACFQAAGGNPQETTVRTIYSIDVDKDGDLISIEVTGDGFLYNMVRIIVGTLVEVGQGKKVPKDVEGIIKSCDRTLAGFTAPAEGLYLEKVFYEKQEELWKE